MRFSGFTPRRVLVLECTVISPLQLRMLKVPSQSAEPIATDSAPSIRELNVQSDMLIIPNCLSAPMPMISFALNSVVMRMLDIVIFPPQELKEPIPPTLSPDIVNPMLPSETEILHGSLKLPIPSAVLVVLDVEARTGDRDIRR